LCTCPITAPGSTPRGKREASTSAKASIHPAREKGSIHVRKGKHLLRPIPPSQFHRHRGAATGGIYGAFAGEFEAEEPRHHQITLRLIQGLRRVLAQPHQAKQGVKRNDLIAGLGENRPRIHPLRDLRYQRLGARILPADRRIGQCSIPAHQCAICSERANCDGLDVPMLHLRADLTAGVGQFSPDLIHVPDAPTLLASGLGR
jgi:hypothetical protein